MPIHLGSLLEAVDPQILTAITGKPKVEPGKEKFRSWRPGHGHGLICTTRVMDAWKSHYDKRGLVRVVHLKTKTSVSLIDPFDCM